MTETKPAAQLAIDELNAQLADWQAEIDSAREQAIGNLGKKTATLALLSDGSVATQSEVETHVNSGQDASHPYENGRRA